MVLNLDDVAAPDREKVRGALPRYRLEVVRDPASRGFLEAWAALDAFFGPRGELEARDAVETFVRDGLLAYDDGMYGHYRLIVAWDGDRFAGVRDCYVDFDPVAEVCVVALSHSWVHPTDRRSGLAAIFRALPVTLAKQIIAENPAVAHFPVLVIAEMEPVTPDEPDSVVRMVAYGRSGFAVMDPKRIPYSQPDFRQTPGSAFNSIPLLGVVRWVDHEGATSIPAYFAAALPRLFHQAHRKYLPADRIDPLEVHAMRTLARQKRDVPLLRLPTATAQVALLAPMVQSAVLAAYPPMLRGGHPELGDAKAEIAAVIARWNA